jgi:AcrR family transcriptional regulator
VEPVKTRKQLAAEETQRVIVEAASRLFLDHGYHATSIGRIAAEAGVAVQTIYNAVGSKRDLLSRVLDFAAAGERAPVPVPQFMREQAEREADPRRIVAQLVEFWRSALPRTAPVLRIIREAAAADPEIAIL